MVSVSHLKIRQAPIIARDDSPTLRGATVARHREPGRARVGAVINRQLFASGNRSSSSDVVETNVPQVGITTVISEMDHACGRQDEMDVLVDRQSIDRWGRGISLGLAHQARQLRRGDQAPCQANDDQVDGEVLCGEEAITFNRRLLDCQVLVKPEVLGRRSIHIDIVSEPAVGALLVRSWYYVTTTMFWAVPAPDPLIEAQVPDAAVHLHPPKVTELMW
jgi:hypothetical protein